MNSASLTVLIAEDDPDDLFFLRRVLSKVAPNAKVSAFAEGQAGMDFLKECLPPHARQPPTIAFVDLRMPKINGLELLRWIRAQSELDPVAVVILTSSVAIDDIAAAAEGGAQCYCSKHMRDKDVIAVLAAAESFSGGRTVKFDLPSNLMK